MKQILFLYSLPEECYNDALQKHESNGSLTHFYDIVGVLQGGTLSQYLFILNLDYVLRTSIFQIKEKWFHI